MCLMKEENFENTSVMRVLSKRDVHVFASGVNHSRWRCFREETV